MDKKTIPVWALVQVDIEAPEFPGQAASVAKNVQKVLDGADMTRVHLFDVGLPDTAARLDTWVQKPQPQVRRTVLEREAAAEDIRVQDALDEHYYPGSTQKESGKR